MAQVSAPALLALRAPAGSGRDTRWRP